MYVSYTPPLSGPLAAALTGAGIPCNGAEADARTRTGDPFITSKALAPNASPREGTPAPTTTAIHADAPSGPPTPRTAQETAAVYAIYTPPAPHDGFTHRFTGGPPAACSAAHCIACGHRLTPPDPTPYCRACWDGQHGHTRRVHTYLQGLGVDESLDRVYHQAMPTVPASALLELTGGLTAP